MNPEKRSAIFARLKRANPKPTTELAYRSPYELLVSVVLSAQATDVSVNRATAQLFPVANTPAAMLALGEERTEALTSVPSACSTPRPSNILAAAQILMEKHGGQVPRERDALEALPGVGRKTANVVLNTAFGEPTIAVDTHIFRVANRTGLAPGKNVREVEEKLLKFTPDKYKQDAHHWLILHGRYVCKARKPECWRCVIADLCEYRRKTPAPDARPVGKRRTKRVKKK